MAIDRESAGYPIEPVIETFDTDLSIGRLKDLAYLVEIGEDARRLAGLISIEHPKYTADEHLKKLKFPVFPLGDEHDEHFYLKSRDKPTPSVEVVFSPMGVVLGALYGTAVAEDPTPEHLELIRDNYLFPEEQDQDAFIPFDQVSLALASDETFSEFTAIGHLRENISGDVEMVVGSVKTSELGISGTEEQTARVQAVVRRIAGLEN